MLLKVSRLALRGRGRRGPPSPRDSTAPRRSGRCGTPLAPGTGAPGGRISVGSPLFTAPILGARCFWVTTWSGHVMCLAL